MDSGQLIHCCVFGLAFVFITIVAVPQPECGQNQARCHDGSQCISKAKFCDREINCPDQSDERLCVLGNCSDHKSYFPCVQTDECVSRDFVCDDINDCSDGSDEHVCDPKENCSLEHDRFLCADRNSCLLSNKVCDGHPDCQDGSDESPRCEISRKACHDGMCGEFGVCKVLPYGPVCICQVGFTLLMDNVTCKDIDECNTHHDRSPCDQVCTNTNGSFICSCLHGYSLESDTHCRVQDADPVLYVAANTGVLAYHIRSGQWTTVFEDQPDIVSLDLGPNDDMYWTAVSETSSRVQFRHMRQQGNWTTHTLVDIGVSSPKGVAVDWMTDAVYMVSEGQIIACLRTRPVRCVVVKDKLDKLQDMIICHHSRTMFWSNWGLAPTITSSDLDGRNTNVIVSQRLRQPTGLVIDWPRKTILWADSLLHRIESSHLDGSHRQIVVSRGLHRPSSLALLEGTLYWTNTREGSVWSCYLYSGCQSISLIKKDLHHPNSLVIGSQRLTGIPKESPMDLVCHIATCSHVCLSGQQGYQCLCPTDQFLTNDDHTCSRTPKADQLYIGTHENILVLPLGQPGYTKDLLLPIIFSPGHTPSSLAVEHSTNTVVYSDSSENIITMATTDILTGLVTGKTLYDSSSIHHVLDITVDWVSGNIYWADAGPKVAIMVGCTSGEHTLTLVKDNLDQPNSLDVDFVNGYLYFSDIGKSPFIGRCRLDGTELTRLDTIVGHPDHLVVSLEDNRLYFMDSHYHQILSVSLPNGADPKTHWQGITGEVLGLAVFGQWIYWTDHQTEGGALCRVHKDDHNKEMCFLRNSNILQGLTVPSTVNSSQVNGCGRNNGGCSHFCFGWRGEVTCRCGEGFTLKEDNQTCQAVPDPNCVFRCQDGHCITDRSYLCDGQPDCTDGEEEDPRHCYHTTPTTPGSFLTGAPCQQPNQCEHVCRETPKGPICDCRQGYELSADQKQCRDVDECEHDNGGCSQLCDNKDGGHLCSCVHGYTKNGSLCYAQEPRSYLVIGGTSGIDTVNDQGQIVELMIGEASGFVTALDVVMETGDIIFTTSVKPTLFLYKRTETNLTRLTTLGSKVTDLSYDWIGHNVYYTDGQHGTLGVCSLQSMPVLCRTLRYEPINSIALHPATGWMFWTSSKDGTIMRMGMDGRNLTILVKATLGQSVLALTIDYATDRIYWIISPASQVWSCDIDGRRRQNILNRVNGHHFASVSVFENTLYLMDKRSKVVYLYNKPSGQQTGVIQLMSTPSCLRVVHPFQQARQVTDVCRARHCSHLCLVTPRGANCYCPDGFQFLPGSVESCKGPATQHLQTVSPKTIPRPSTENTQRQSTYTIENPSPRPVPEITQRESTHTIVNPSPRPVPEITQRESTHTIVNPSPRPVPEITQRESTHTTVNPSPRPVPEITQRESTHTIVNPIPRPVPEITQRESTQPTVNPSPRLVPEITQRESTHTIVNPSPRPVPEITQRESTHTTVNPSPVRPVPENTQRQSTYTPVNSSPRPVPENTQRQSAYQVKTTPPISVSKSPKLEPTYQVKTISRSSTQKLRPYKVMTSPRPATNNPQIKAPTPGLVNLELPEVKPPPPKVHLGIQHVQYPNSKEDNLCEMKCENGGTCVIAGDRHYCSCVGGYSGATCGEVDTAANGEITTDDKQSMIIGVTVAVVIAIIVIVIISVVCWIKHRSGRSFPDYMPCVAHPRKVFTAGEDAEGLVSDSSTFGDLRFDSDVTFREFDTVSYQTSSSSTEPVHCEPNNFRSADKNQVYNPRDIYYCPSNQSFGTAFSRQEESHDRPSSGDSSSSSL